MQWVDQLRDHGSKEYDNHDQWSHILPHDGPEYHHSWSDSPCGDVVEETVERVDEGGEGDREMVVREIGGVKMDKNVQLHTK